MTKYFLTVFIAILIPTYTYSYGPQNFLWMSDISLFLIFTALWIKSALLISMVALLTLIIEFFWCIDYFITLITGNNYLRMADYMFDTNLSLFLRGLSLFHLLLPVYSLKYLCKWGYDHRALYYSIPVVWIVVLSCYFLTPIEDNINWVHLPAKYQWTDVNPIIWVLFLMILHPIFIIIPKNYLFKKIFRRADEITS